MYLWTSDRKCHITSLWLYKIWAAKIFYITTKKHKHENNLFQCENDYYEDCTFSVPLLFYMTFYTTSVWRITYKMFLVSHNFLIPTLRLVILSDSWWLLIHRGISLKEHRTLPFQTVPGNKTSAITNILCKLNTYITMDMLCHDHFKHRDLNYE